MLSGVGSYWHIRRAISACVNPLRVPSFLKQPWLNKIIPRSASKTLQCSLSTLTNKKEQKEQPSPELLAAVHQIFHGPRIKPRALAFVRNSSLLSKQLLDREQVRKLAQAMAKVSPPRAHQLLTIAHKLGCHLKQNAYECVAFQLAQSARWHLIPRIVSLGMRDTGRTTVRLLNWQARARIELNYFAHLETLLDEFQKWGLTPNRTTFHLLSSGHIRNRDLVKAKACLLTMESQGITANPSTHALVATSYRSLGPDEQVRARAVEALQNASRTSATAILNALIHLEIETGDVSGFLQELSAFDDIPRYVPIISLKSPNQYISRHGGNLPLSTVGGTSPPERILRSVLFDTSTFSILIDYLTNSNDFPRALAVYRNMIALGVPPDARTVAALVRLHFAMGDDATAILITAKMCNCSDELSHVLARLTSTSSQAVNIPLSSSQPAIPLSIEILNALLKGLLDLHGMKGAYALLRMMHGARFVPNSKTIELLVTHLHRTARTNPVPLLSFFRNTYSDVPLTLRHVHVLLGSILRREKRLRYSAGWNLAASNFVANQRDEPQPVSTTRAARKFDPIAGILLPDKASYRALMHPFLHSLATRGVRSDRASCALRIRYDAVNNCDLNSARGVFQTMLARGMHPNAYHYSALMEGYERQGNLRAAQAVLRSAERAGVRPNVVMYTILIVGHARRGDPESAMQTFRQMTAAGIQPDVPAIDAVSSAYFIVGAQAMSRRILCSLWPLIQPFPKAFRSASLRTLARKFRALHRYKRLNQLVSPKEERMVRRRLELLLQTWRHGHSRYSKNNTQAIASNSSIHHSRPVPRTQPRQEATGFR